MSAANSARQQTMTTRTALSVKSRRIFVTILLTSAAFLPLNAHAWGSEAHRLIADIAETQLAAVTKAEVH